MIPFTDTLRQARNGQIVDRLSEDLTALVKAVDATEKAGTLTLTIKVSPDKTGGTQKTLQFDVKSKIPTHPTPDAIFFSDADGNLQRNDPNQREMFSDSESYRKTGRE